MVRCNGSTSKEATPYNLIIVITLYNQFIKI